MKLMLDMLLAHKPNTIGQKKNGLLGWRRSFVKRFLLIVLPMTIQGLLTDEAIHCTLIHNIHHALILYDLTD